MSEHITLVQDEEPLTEPYLDRLSGAAAVASNELLENCRLLKATEGVAHSQNSHAQTTADAQRQRVTRATYAI